MIGANVATLRNGTNQHAEKEGSSTELPSKIASKTQEAAAKEVGVSVATIKRAKVVKAKAVPDIVSAVEAGHVTLNAAEQVAKLPRLSG